MKEFDSIATESLNSKRIRNLTPHPVRVFSYPFCFIFAMPETGQDGWTEEVREGSARLGGYVEIPPDDGTKLRLEEDDITRDDVEVGRFYDVPETQSGLMSACSVRSYGPPVDLPEEKLGVTLIVSLPFAMGLAAAGIGRDDIVCPDTGPSAKRDDQGHLTAVTGFVRVLTVAQLDAHHRGVDEGQKQRTADQDERDRGVASGPPVLSLDSRSESPGLRKSFERGARTGWETRRPGYGLDAQAAPKETQ